MHKQNKGDEGEPRDQRCQPAIKLAVALLVPRLNFFWCGVIHDSSNILAEIMRMTSERSEGESRS